MSEEDKNPKWLTPINVGFSLTAIVLLGFASMAWRRNCVLLPTEVLECRRNWAWFLDAPPNEIGDTLAGFAGVLAFVWIITTVWLQGHELQEQRKELELTRLELKLARQAQEKQLDIMHKQADIFEEEKSQRRWDREKSVLDERLDDLMAEIGEEASLQGTWRRLNKDPNIIIDTRIRIFTGNGGKKHETDHLDEKFRHAALISESKLNQICKIAELRELTERSENREYYSEILKKCQVVLQMRDQLSEDQKIRLDSIGIGRISVSIEQLLSADVWKTNP
ncbi:MAG: hypothetical protein JNJ84_06405 [Rhodobacteraceae bacterium]|nr:hypothetical protein [Paracoccaceae bacterium]